MSRISPFALLFLALSVLRVSAQGPPTPDAQVALVFDDQKISDGDLARLFALVAESFPQERWRRVSVAGATDLRTIIDRYFDYYSAGLYAAPRTVAALTDMIRANNELPGLSAAASSTLRLPPVPIRAHGQFDFPRELRLYNAGANAYAI